jgi:hypothetical protein
MKLLRSHQQQTTAHAYGVDDDTHPTPDPVPGMGHFNPTLLVHFSQAPKTTC